MGLPVVSSGLLVGVLPSQEELLAELQALKANPKMGAKGLQAAVKEKNPTWFLSASRVKKVAVEGGLLSCNRYATPL